MAIAVGDTVLVYYDLLLFDAVVLKIEAGAESVRYFVHFSEWTDNWDEWIDQQNVLEDSAANRERQRKAKAELVIPNGANAQKQKQQEGKMPITVPGSERLVAMIGWMKTLDDALTKLDRQVKDLVREQISQEAGALQLKKRKAEAEVQKAELEVEVARDLKRVKIAEETALARKRLKDAGISQDEIDTILPQLDRPATVDGRV